MNHVILTISGININNEDTVMGILADAGYKGAHKRINDETVTLDIGTAEERETAGIDAREVYGLIGSLILNTSVKVQSELATPEGHVKAKDVKGNQRIMINGVEYITCRDAFRVDSDLVCIDYREPQYHVTMQLRFFHNAPVKLV